MASEKNFPQGFNTLCIHGGHRPDGHRAHLTPIYASSTYTFDNTAQGEALFNGTEDGYLYGRFGSPTVREAEEKIALMEGFGLEENGAGMMPKALLHASGMAAIHTLLLSTLSTGDAILTQESLYGGTQEAFDRILPPLGIRYYVADLNDEAALAQALAAHPEVKLVYAETPDNPTLRLINLEQLGTFCKQNSLMLAVDNTFCTPYLQQPFRFGADYIIHSTTKFLNGHGTAIGGALVARNAALLSPRVVKTFRLLGGCASAFDAFLLVNGMRTLPLRVDKHCENAEKIAAYLSSHSAVSAVHFPGLESHAQHALAKTQMRHFGSMLSFELKGGYAAATAFLDALKLCTFAVSLGTTDTLMCHPASSTHKGVELETRRRAGVSDGLIRVSVGLENAEDIIRDLEQAISHQS